MAQDLSRQEFRGLKYEQWFYVFIQVLDVMMLRLT